MSSIEVNFSNLSESERKQLISLVEKSNNKVKLSDIENGATFKIGEVVFIKFYDKSGETVAVTKDIVFNSCFGENNDFRKSTALNRLQKEFLPKIEALVGEKNIHQFSTNLTALDGLKTYGLTVSKVSLPTLDFYRENVEIFDKYKPDKWWWLATPESGTAHDTDNYTLCVSHSGSVGSYVYDYNYGVRPILHFVSSISVSYDR